MPPLRRDTAARWKEIIDQLYSYPCIVVWTPFNECWGQFKTADIVAYTQSLDNTRLVNPASGGNHYRLGEGTIVDQHTYDQPIRVFEGIFDPSVLSFLANTADSDATSWDTAGSRARRTDI